MTSSKSFSSRIAIVLLLGIINMSGCAASLPEVTGEAGAGAGVAGIAVLPIDNLSGGAAPVKALRQELIARLKAKGLVVLPDELLDAFMALHRIRYVGGMDKATSEAFLKEMGVSAVMITSLELYNESYPPRVALTARLVATGDEPHIIRMERSAMAGDDTPGLLGIGLIEDPLVLRARVLDRLADALTSRRGISNGLALPPESLYRTQALDPARTYSVTVMPFFNKSSRKYAGEILALHFIRELTRYPMFNVIEPGLVREELLQYRVIMEDGVSLADAEIVFGMLKTDLLLSGNVNDYEDHQGSFGAPIVDFSVLMLDRESRKAVWAVDAHYTGDDRVYFFDFGKVTTASGLAAAITRGAIESLYKTE
jgi:hypothetical protein